MSKKRKPLLSSEIQINHDDLFFKEIVDYANESGKQINDIKVLDYGCGRGRYVGFLLSQNINAFGIDIDPIVVSQAKVLFEQNNWDFSLRMKVITPDNRTPFPDRYFDFIFSDQVFEHVKDIRRLTIELCRISKKECKHIHRWPAKFRIIEPHLFMPFVHWLPKGIIRYLVILFYVAVRKEPKWEELKSKGILTKTAVYAKYSNQKTYYRRLSVISSLFKESWDQEYLSTYRPQNRLFRKISTKLKLNRLLGLYFNTVILELSR